MEGCGSFSGPHAQFQPWRCPAAAFQRERREKVSEEGKIFKKKRKEKEASSYLTMIASVDKDVGWKTQRREIKVLMV